jgi:adenylylsulfate kinase-like enzyme
VFATTESGRVVWWTGSSSYGESSISGRSPFRPSRRR